MKELWKSAIMQKVRKKQKTAIHKSNMNSMGNTIRKEWQLCTVLQYGHTVLKAKAPNLTPSATQAKIPYLILPFLFRAAVIWTVCCLICGVYMYTSFLFTIFLLVYIGGNLITYFKFLKLLFPSSKAGYYWGATHMYILIVFHAY